MPGVEDERQVVEQRARLAELARSWRGRPVGDADLEEALDAAEFVLRLHFLGGLGTQLEQLLPSLVYLLMAPLAGRKEALSLAGRSPELLDGYAQDVLTGTATRRD